PPASQYGIRSRATPCARVRSHGPGTPRSRHPWPPAPRFRPRKRPGGSWYAHVDGHGGRLQDAVQNRFQENLEGVQAVQITDKIEGIQTERTIDAQGRDGGHFRVNHIAEIYRIPENIGIISVDFAGDLPLHGA